MAIAGLALIIVIAVGVSQVRTVRKAHSSFENYYAFRGCVQLIKRAPDYAICKTASGQTIKIVLYRGKWYLNNDLPTCLFNFCN